MVAVTFDPEEFSVRQFAARGGRRELAANQGSFGFDEIGTVLSFAGGAPFPIAGMMFEVVGVVHSIAFVAEIGFAEEPFERIAPVIVVAIFDEPYDVV